MFERLTDRARKVMALANQEAQRLNHEYIGTEHILLGLVKEGSGVGANVLKNLDIDLRKVRLEVEKDVLRPDVLVVESLGFLVGQGHHLAGSVRQSFEHGGLLPVPFLSSERVS